MPEAIFRASGIAVMGRRIKSLLFSTDIAAVVNRSMDIEARLSAGAAILNFSATERKRHQLYAAVHQGAVSEHHERLSAELIAALKAYFSILRLP